MPEKTKEELREDGFFITGDIGVIDADGYVSIVGRQKELIIDEHPAALESAVIGLPTRISAKG